MGREILGHIEPLVRHNAWEWALGTPLAHVLRQSAATAYLMGQGQPVQEAMHTVEGWEKQGLFPLVHFRPQQMPAMWERHEPYHRMWGCNGDGMSN